MRQRIDSRGRFDQFVVRVIRFLKRSALSRAFLPPVAVLAALLVVPASVVASQALSSNAVPAVAAGGGGRSPADQPLTLEMLAPFFDQSTDAAELAPLRTWIAQRATGAGVRRTEGEIRAALKKLRHQREQNLQTPYDVAGALYLERLRLRSELVNQQTTARDAATRYAKLARVPAMEDLFPTITGIPLVPRDDADLSVSGGGGAPDLDPAPAVARVGDALPRDPDVRDLMDRLERDTTRLRRMMDAAEQQDEVEEQRLTRALKTLPEFVRAAIAPPAANSIKN